MLPASLCLVAPDCHLIATQHVKTAPYKPDELPYMLNKRNTQGTLTGEGGPFIIPANNAEVNCSRYDGSMY